MNNLTAKQRMVDSLMGSSPLSQAEYFASKPTNMFNNSMVAMCRADLKRYNNTTAMQNMRRDVDAINGVSSTRHKKGKQRQPVERHGPEQLLQMVRDFSHTYTHFASLLAYREENGELVKQVPGSLPGIECVESTMWTAFMNALLYVHCEEDMAATKKKDVSLAPSYEPLSDARKRMLEEHQAGTAYVDPSEAI